jgi:DHA1 family tetracycline resistance protein-like MFS transporter
MDPKTPQLPVLPASRLPAFIFIFITVMLDMLALGIIVPVLPKLVIAFKGGDTASAATIYGLFGTVWATMQFIFAPLLGAISDRYGRRPVILISTLGLGLDYLLMAAAPTLGWLFVGRTISGITSASYATAFAYIADVTPQRQRAAKYGLLGAAFGIGFIIGPALGGILGGINLRLPFWVAGALSLLGTAYGWFILPESLPTERRASIQWRRANPVGSLGMLRQHGPALMAFGAAVFLYRLAHDSFPALFVLYGDYRFGWDARTVGMVLAAIGIATMIVQAGLVRTAVRRLGERRAMLSGLGFGIAGLTIFGLAPSATLFLVAIPFTALFGLTYPAMQGMITGLVSDDEQGRLQGALASLTGMAGIIAPSLFTNVFSLVIGDWHGRLPPGTPWLIAAVLLVGAMGVVSRRARE